MPTPTCETTDALRQDVLAVGLILQNDAALVEDAFASDPALAREARRLIVDLFDLFDGIQARAFEPEVTK